MLSRLVFARTAGALAVILSVLAALRGGALAETGRVAVVVGNNAGSGDRPPLRFAETDAEKVAEVLMDLGGFRSEDVILLRGRSGADLASAFAEVRRRVALWHARPGARVILLFFFSGHSDGQTLELGPRRLPFAEVRGWITATGADARISVVDSCRSGALIVGKGGERGQGFEIRLADDLASTGDVLITSSASDESALESREIRGSFFTHHFISALRGAADLSGDGQVTLSEAYQYAYAHTLSSTANTLVGPQHPAYDYQLSGHGDLVMTQLAAPSATLVLAPDYDRFVVTDLRRDRVVAEATAGAALRISVRPGPYSVRAWRGAQLYIGRLEVARGQTKGLSGDLLTEAPAVAARSKGEPEVATSRAPADRPGWTWPWRAPALLGTVGVAGGVARSVPPLVAGRLQLRASAERSSVTIAVGVAAGEGGLVREEHAAIAAGWLLRWGRSRLEAHAGLEVAAGVIRQSVEGGRVLSSGTLSAAPVLSVSVQVWRRLSVVATGQVAANMLREGDNLALRILPAAWLGTMVSL